LPAIVYGQDYLVDTNNNYYIDTNDNNFYYEEPDNLKFTTTEIGTFSGGIEFSSGKLYVNWGNDLEYITTSADDNLSHTYYNSNEKEVTVNFLGGYEDVTQLWLGDVGLNRVYDYSNLTNLIRLYLYKNNLNSVPDYSNLTNLTHLRLNSNNLDSVPDYSNLTNLQKLLLYKNDLNSVPDYSNLTNLTYLDLNSNNLDSVPDYSNLTNLIRLYLYNNDLNSVPDYSNLTNLQKLYLNSNNLDSVPDYSNLTNLQYLYLDNNNLDTIIDQTLPGEEWDGINFRIDNNIELSAASISQLLIDLDEGSGGTEAENGDLDISGCNGGTLLYNDLTTAGKAAYDSLETKGWTITTDD
jgi:Leucine-rich repeat (LRR) protein